MEIALCMHINYMCPNTVYWNPYVKQCILLLNCILYLCGIELFAYYDKFEDTKGVIRSRNTKDRHYNGNRKP